MHKAQKRTTSGWWQISLGRPSAVLIDALVFAGALALFYGIISAARAWMGPFTQSVEIHREPRYLPMYAGYSLLRIFLAYFFSLLFTFVYGYIAAYNPRAEKFMIPLLDVLQSIPVLSFLPPVMLAVVTLFPKHQLGLEMGAILLIFTGQVWNMVFSFYSSLKTIPRDMREAARIYRFNWWQRFVNLELPASVIGLVWNSMMSVAGGWFFLMACEMFVLGTRDFRLPGLGSYLQTAASAGDTQAILWGMFTMVGVIVVLDQVLWRPVIAWSEKFKLEQVEATEAPTSWFLDLMQRSGLLRALNKQMIDPMAEKLALAFARRSEAQPDEEKSSLLQRVILIAFGVAVLVAVGYGAAKMAVMLTGITRPQVGQLGRGLIATFVRVNVTLLIASLWTIPVGVAIGSNRKLAKIAQPLAQIAASVPATALFPIVLLLLIKIGGGLGVASIILLLLGTQWYVLFNVIAGAMAIPTDLKEASAIFSIQGWDRWRKLVLPAIFPYLITGLVTASGGAWNASIVAEYFHFRGQIYQTVGLGATISEATDKGDFALLVAATLAMAAIVVTTNRLVWRRLYRLAETRFSFDT
jgi:NitT/TauT family transport system permease protein